MEVEGGFDGGITLTDQSGEQTEIAGVDGSGLQHLAMTAAMEQQNMIGEVCCTFVYIQARANYCVINT